MKILLDECVPLPMRRILIGYVCSSVQQCGWSGIKNGSLLSLADGKFDLFITSDQNIRYQQNLSGFQVAVLQLSTNNLRRILGAASLIQATVEAIVRGEFRTLVIQ